MILAGKGAILLTGATAGVKGFALSSPFAVGKFALRGLTQSAARELERFPFSLSRGGGVHAGVVG